MRVKKLFHLSWPYTAIVGAHVIWGVNFLVAKLTLQEFPLMSLAFLRFAIAFLLLLPFLFLQKNSLKVSPKDLPWLFLVGVLMVTLNIAFFYTGLERTDITSASVLTMAIPVFSVIFGWIVLREKIYLFNLMGILFGLAGSVVVIGLPSVLLGVQQMPAQAIIGNILILFASLVWVVGAIISKRTLQKYSTLTITAFMFLTGALTFLIPASIEYFQHPEWPSRVTYFGFFGLAYISIASSISAYFLFEWGLKKLGVVKADLFQYLEPLIAATLGILILQEPLQASFIIGGALILGGVYWSTLARDFHKHHKAHRT